MLCHKSYSGQRAPRPEHNLPPYTEKADNRKRLPASERQITENACLHQKGR
jgi:hypothetical protein